MGTGASCKPNYRFRVARPIMLAAVVVVGPWWQQVAPAQGASPAQGGQESVLELSLLDAIEMALQQNLRVHISRVSAEISREGIDRARSIFDPTLIFDIPGSTSRRVQPAASQIDGAPVNVTTGFSGGFSFSEQLPWGTQWSVSWTGSREATNSTFSTVNPRLQSGLSFQLSQSLLRGFGREVNTEQIIVAGYSYTRSQEQLRQETQQVALDTYRAYWNLVYRNQELEIRRDALDLSHRQLDRGRMQRQLGTGNQLDVVQREVRVADDEFRLLQAQVSVEDAQDSLKRLLNIDEAGAGAWQRNIRPTDTPEYTLRPLDVDEAIETALRRDPTLLQLRLDSSSQEIQVNAAKNGTLPALDLTASLGLNGQGGDRIIRSGDLGGTAAEVIDGGFGDSIRQLFSGDLRSWAVGLRLMLPVHNTDARAAYAQSRLQQQQIALRISDREQELTVNIRAATRRLESLRRQVEAAMIAREAAERQLALSERQIEVGAGDVFQLLTFQVDLANARLQEQQLIIDINNALAEFEAAKGTLLDSLGIGFAPR